MKLPHLLTCRYCFAHAAIFAAMAAAAVALALAILPRPARADLTATALALAEAQLRGEPITTAAAPIVISRQKIHSAAPTLAPPQPQAAAVPIVVAPQIAFAPANSPPPGYRWVRTNERQCGPRGCVTVQRWRLQSLPR